LDRSQAQSRDARRAFTPWSAGEAASIVGRIRIAAALKACAHACIVSAWLLTTIGAAASADVPLLAANGNERPDGGRSTLPAAARVDFGAMPISFESNAGQLPPGTQARVFGAPLATYLTRNGTAIVHSKPARATSAIGLKTAKAGRVDATEQYSLELVDASSSSAGEMESPIPTRTHYLIGSDRAKWVTDVAHYQRVRYRNVYPGIDQVFHASTGQLEYDLIVAPGADPGVIRLRIGGSQPVRLTPAGDIAIQLGDATLLQKLPVAYQDGADGRTSVDASYQLEDSGEIRLRLGDYDRSRPLTIDPVLSYSSFFYIAYAQFTGVAVDAAGAAYVVGTVSGNYVLPLPNPIETYVDIPATYAHDFNNSGDNIFVAKFAPSGAFLEYATFLGSSEDDRSGGIAVSPAGEAVIGAVATGTDYPVVNALFPDGAVYSRIVDYSVVSALAKDGASLRYSYYLAPRPYATSFDVDYGVDPRVAIAPNGSVWIAAVGVRNGAAIPQPPPVETNYHCGNALLWRIAADGTREDFTKCLAGSFISGLAVDANGNAYVSGSANSEFFSTGPISPKIANPSPFDTAVWVDKIDAAGANVVYHATFPGGPSDGGGTTFSNRAVAVAADSSGNAYITGFTPSIIYPLVNVRDAGLMTTGMSAGARKQFAFVTKINPTGTAIPYSTFLNLNLSPDNQVFVTGIGVDDTGHAFVAGTTGRYSGAFVGVDAYSLQDVFVAKIDNQGRSVLADYRLGGSSGEVNSAFALGAHNEMYVAGLTLSPDFPLLNSISGWAVPFGTSSANSATFFSKFVDDPDPTSMTIGSAKNPVPIRTDIVFTATVPGASGSINWFVDEQPVGVNDLVFGKHDVAFTLGGMKRGTYNIRAVYVPDDTSLPTLSATLTQQVLLPEECP
jgi:Beta-propeller repeat